MSCNCNHIMGFMLMGGLVGLHDIKEWEKGGFLKAADLKMLIPHYLTKFNHCPTCGDNISDIIEALAA